MLNLVVTIIFLTIRTYQIQLRFFFNYLYDRQNLTRWYQCVEGKKKRLEISSIERMIFIILQLKLIMIFIYQTLNGKERLRIM